MAQVRPFRFGTHVQATSRSELIDQVHKAEELGYSSATVTDHVSMPRLAPIATLAAMAALDSSLRLTSTVFGNDFRHPAMLASEAATIDVISNGRLELGIGTGYWEPDYEQPGIPFDPPGTRVNRLAEAVQVMKALFSDQPVSFVGEHYVIRDLNLMPKPVQRPHPPLLIGGGGRRMLSLAAREADIVSVNPTTKDGTMDFRTLTPEAFAQKISWVRAAAADRFADLELNIMLFNVMVTENQVQAAEEWLKRMESMIGSPLGISSDEVLASPYILIGSVEQMIAKLRECRDTHGVSYFTPSSNIPMATLAPVISQLTE